MIKRLAIAALGVLLGAAPARAAEGGRDIHRGIYGLTAGGDFYANLAAAKAGGFDLVVVNPYQEHLDAVAGAGMQAIVAFWLSPEDAATPEKWAAFQARIRSGVARFQGHRAVFAWYIADEPDGEGIPVDNIRQITSLARSLDPKTPLLAVFNSPRRWAEYFPYFDILCVDPYLRRRRILGGYETTEVVTRWLRAARQDLARLGLKKPLWAVLGAFDSRPKAVGQAPGYKKPTPDEFRDMVGRARQEGVDGILVYTFAFKESTRTYSWRLTQDDPKLWESVQRDLRGPRGRAP
ncbi:MAG: glycoside hydrolase family 2 TIM barrel-domain containing protein [Elusimicrobiota bacterium]|jgi:hypothetical protein